MYVSGHRNLFYFIVCSRAQPVDLPSGPISVSEGASFVVSGWGTTSEGGSLPSTLRYLSTLIKLNDT